MAKTVAVMLNRYFEDGDTNFDGDATYEFIVDGVVIAVSDYYHFKVQTYADGFIAGLKHAGVEVEVIPGYRAANSSQAWRTIIPEESF